MLQKIAPIIFHVVTNSHLVQLINYFSKKMFI